jgi:hypothetical protein
MPKVKKGSKTRKIKLKQQVRRHRKSRVIRMKSRKNRYRRKTKYKVGGGKLDYVVFAKIRSFIKENGNNVANAEEAYRTLYTEFALLVEGSCFDPANTTGMFSKKNRLRDILEKIKAVPDDQPADQTLDVGEPRDYQELFDSILKMQELQLKKKKEELKKEWKKEDTRLKEANNRKILEDQQQALLASQQKKAYYEQNRYHKVYIDDSNIVPNPSGLELFESGTDNTATKIPIKIPPSNNPKVSWVSSRAITKDTYDGIGTDATTKSNRDPTDGKDTTYHYKRDPHDPTAYYLHNESGNGIYSLTRELDSRSSKNYEYRIRADDPVRGCNARIYIDPKYGLKDEHVAEITQLWNYANCLLQTHTDFFTGVNPAIVSPSKKTLTDLVISRDRDNKPYYESGTFKGVVLTVKVYDSKETAIKKADKAWENDGSAEEFRQGPATSGVKNINRHQYKPGDIAVLR